MKLLHVAPIDGRPGSGLTYAIPALINAQQRAGAAVKMLASGLDPKPITNAEYSIVWKKELGRAGQPILDELIDWSDLVIFHSTYIPFHAKVSRCARRHGVPMIITPHGGMTALAGDIKRLKKIIGNYIFFNGLVTNCRAIHFLSDNEARSSSHWQRPSFVVPNGIEQVPFSERSKHCSDPINLVFISRISIIHKGLDLLVEAIRLLLSKSDVPDFVLNVYGPGLPAEIRMLNRMIDQKKLHPHITVHPPVYAEDKQRVLRNADLFVLTSRFEGHPMAVLEALAHGVPCLASVGTNMSVEIQDADAGWVCADDLDSMTKAMHDALQGRKEYIKRGQAARKLAAAYSWDSIAKRTLQEYTETLGEGGVK